MTAVQFTTVEYVSLVREAITQYSLYTACINTHPQNDGKITAVERNCKNSLHTHDILISYIVIQAVYIAHSDIVCK